MPLLPPLPGAGSRAVSRRRLLAGAGAAAGLGVVAGCTSSGDTQVTPSPVRSTVTPPPRPDVGLAASVLRHERQVLARVEATAGRHPTTGRAVAGARRAHRAHVLLLERAVPDGATPSSTTRRPRVPRTAPAALAALARAEDALAAQDRRSALAADSGSFARVLASMAAAASQQSAVLGAAARAGT